MGPEDFGGPFARKRDADRLQVDDVAAARELGPGGQRRGMVSQSAS